MAMKPINFVGAKRTAYLPDWIPVEIRIVDHPRTRSFQRFTNQTKTTYHDTGNPRTRAWGEYNWLAGGRQGGVVGGYQFIFDDSVLIQTGPLNEVSWHAGTPIGNQSFGAEHAFGGGTDWVTSLEIGCALHGALIEMQGLDPDDAAVLHQFWTGKYCSAQILNRGIWPQVKAKIREYWSMAREARLGGGEYVPTPPISRYAPQMPVTLPDGTRWDGTKNVTINGQLFVAQKGKAKTIVDLRRRQWASTQSLDVGPVLPVDTEFEVLGWVAGELVDGISEWWVTPGGTRLWGGGVDLTPVNIPDYGKEPEHVPGMQIVNGRIYYPLNHEETGIQGRPITVKQPGNLRRWADTDSEIVGTVKPGDELVFRYWTRGEEVPLYQGGPMEMIWYSEDLHTGARMWAGLSDERPD